MAAVRTRRALMLALATSGGCAAAVQSDPPAAKDGALTSCAAVDSTTRSAAITGQLVGEYRLTMIATSGARTGGSATGTLTLDGRVGHASIALASVGAVAAGDITSRDPNRPGVMLVRSPNDSSASAPMLRFGADANRSDIRACDGAYLILLVDAATAT